MPLQTKELQFHKTRITFVYFEGVWCVPAKLLGQALGYANDGQSLADVISTSWAKKWGPGDLINLTGPLLEGFKEATSEYNVAFKQASHILLLGISGVTKTLLRSRSKSATEFREFLSKNAGDLLPANDLLMLSESTQKTKSPKAKKEIDIPQSKNLPEELQKPLSVLREMALTGFFSKEDLAGYYKRVFESTLPAAPALPAVIPTAAAVTKKDATQMVPVSNIQASSLTPNFTAIRSFFLTGHQKHPDFMQWLTAEEIGAKCGKTADQVKTFSSNYARSHGRDLANNQAKAAILQAGGYFEGVSSLVDDRRLPSFVDHEIGCMSTWYLMEEGMLVWRNYWSPRAVEEIEKLIAASSTVRAPKLAAPTLPLPEGKTYQFEGAVQAPAPSPSNGAKTKST